MNAGRVLVLLAAVSSVYGIPQDTCLRYNGGSCCAQLTALDRPLEDAAQDQPTYIVLLPSNEESCTIDNICITLFPLPDDSYTYIAYVSRVYTNGFNEINTLIVSTPEPGVQSFGQGLCVFTDTIFAEVQCEENVLLSYRCEMYGQCSVTELFDHPFGVYGSSNERRPISTHCVNKARTAIRNNGLPADDFYALPMRLPSRCVLNQVCSVTSGLQRFCQTVGVAFPAVNRCSNQSYQRVY